MGTYKKVKYLYWIFTRTIYMYGTRGILFFLGILLWMKIVIFSYILISWHNIISVCGFFFLVTNSNFLFFKLLSWWFCCELKNLVSSYYLIQENSWFYWRTATLIFKNYRILVPVLVSYQVSYLYRTGYCIRTYAT